MSINILDELYNDLFHMTKVEDTDGTYKAALDKLVKAEEELIKAYPDSTNIQSMTWKPEPKVTAKQIEKKLNRQAVMFEEACNKGFQSKAIKFEVFAEQWFEEYAKPNLRNTTYERMLQLRKRVYSAIGHLRMDKITPRQIQAFVNFLSKDGANERTGKPLAPKTIRHNLSFVSDVFAYAVKMGVVSDNPSVQRARSQRANRLRRKSTRPNRCRSFFRC